MDTPLQAIPCDFAGLTLLAQGEERFAEEAAAPPGQGSPAASNSRRRPKLTCLFERRMIVAMGADFNEAREELPSVIQSLPRRLRESNAAQFLGIVEELRRSFVLELELAQRVSRVNVEDPPAVTQLRWTLED